MRVMRGFRGMGGMRGMRGMGGMSGYEGDEGLSRFSGLSGLSGLNGLEALEGLKGLEGGKGVKGVKGIEGADLAAIYIYSHIVSTPLGIGYMALLGFGAKCVGGVDGVECSGVHTSYLSILVHRRIIEVYKKYTKKLSELATK